MSLPPKLRPLASLGPDTATSTGLAELPHGVPAAVSDNPLPALMARLAGALARSEADRRNVAERAPGPDRSQQLPSSLPIPAPDLRAEMAPTGADFQNLKLYQYNVNANGSYRHLDFGMIGLAYAAGIWREARLKLFDRRGIVGLEFRSLRDWPIVFDIWPGESRDQFGPFWHLETQGVLESLVELGSSHNRIVVAAILEALPTAARHAAALAGLAGEEQEAWSVRGRTLLTTVATAVSSSVAPPAGGSM